MALSAVSVRTKRALRDTGLFIWFFSSVGSKCIEQPPQLPKSTGIEVKDLFIHRNLSREGDYEAWRCTSIKSRIVWKSLPLYTIEADKKGTLRTFVITKTGLPGWVEKQTVQRKYRHRKVAKSKVEDGRNQEVIRKEEKGKSRA